MMTPVRMTLLGISIASVAMGSGLSKEMEARMPAILERVLEELGRAAPGARAGCG
jgi:Ni,Fe-hydrogenase maturation factor